MPGTITALKVQKRNKNRVNVYLDERYSFSLADVLAVPLRRGQFLSDEEIARLKEEDEYLYVYRRAVRLIDYRPRSIAEVRRRMERQGTAPDLVEKVIEKLVSAGLLDDAEFARLWVENREVFRPRSHKMLRYELRQKGLDETAIAPVLEQVDEEQSAHRLARERGQRLSRLDWPDFRRKLTGYLARRGYPYDITRSAVQEAWQSLLKSDDNTLDHSQESEDEEWTC